MRSLSLEDLMNLLSSFMAQEEVSDKKLFLVVRLYIFFFIEKFSTV